MEYNAHVSYDADVNYDGGDEPAPKVYYYLMLPGTKVGGMLCRQESS